MKNLFLFSSPLPNKIAKNTISTQTHAYKEKYSKCRILTESNKIIKIKMRDLLKSTQLLKVNLVQIKLTRNGSRKCGYFRFVCLVLPEVPDLSVFARLYFFAVYANFYIFFQTFLFIFLIEEKIPSDGHWSPIFTFVVLLVRVTSETVKATQNTCILLL